LSQRSVNSPYVYTPLHSGGTRERKSDSAHFGVFRTRSRRRHKSLRRGRKQRMQSGFHWPWAAQPGGRSLRSRDRDGCNRASCWRPAPRDRRMRNGHKQLHSRRKLWCM